MSDQKEAIKLSYTGLKLWVNENSQKTKKQYGATIYWSINIFIEITLLIMNVANALNIDISYFLSQ